MLFQNDSARRPSILTRLSPRGAEHAGDPGRRDRADPAGADGGLQPCPHVGDQIIEALRLHQRKWRPSGPALSTADARIDHGRAVPERRHLDARRAGGRLCLAALGWSAAAGDDRHGAVVPAPAPDRRRAHHRARRDDAGADPEPAARPAAPASRPRSSSSPTISASSPQIAHSVVVMYLGRVMEHGPVDDIFHAPKHPYTRALLHSIPSLLATPQSLAAHHRRLDPPPARTARRLPLPSALSRRASPTSARATPRRSGAIEGDAVRQLLPLPSRRGESEP